MDLTTVLIPHAVPFSLVFARVTGIFLLTPILTSGTIPMRVRAMLAVSFAAASYPFVPAGVLPQTVGDVWVLAPMLVGELAVGFVLGLFAQLPLVAVQMAGYIMGYQMGLAIAQAYNPELDTESGVIGQLLFFLAAMTFALVGGLEIMFIALATTFETIPIGGLTGWTVPIDPVVGLLHAGFELALRLSMPIMAVVMLILLAIGFATKTMPQINVMTVGFAMKILAGIGSLAAVAFVLDGEIAAEILRVLDLIVEWASHPLGGADG